MSIDEMLAAARDGWQRVEASQLADEFVAGALVIDTRPVEQRERDGALPGAVVIDRNVLEWRLDPASEFRIEQVTDHDQRMVVVCNEGYSSSLVVAGLHRMGIHRATDLIDGYQGWLAMNSPTS